MIAWLDQGFRFGLGCFASENCILMMDRDRVLMTILFVSAGLALELRFGLDCPVSENCILMMNHDGVLITVDFVSLHCKVRSEKHSMCTTQCFARSRSNSKEKLHLPWPTSFAASIRFWSAHSAAKNGTHSRSTIGASTATRRPTSGTFVGPYRTITRC